MKLPTDVRIDKDTAKRLIEIKQMTKLKYVHIVNNAVQEYQEKLKEVLK